MSLLRLFGCGSGCLVFILGIMGAINLTNAFSPKTMIFNIYLILFGALIIFAELRWVRFLKGFRFLTTYFGLGIFYVFVGGIAVDNGIANIIAAIFLVFIGLVYVCFAVLNKKMFETPPGEPVGQELAQQAQQAHQMAQTAQKMQRFMAPAATTEGEQQV